MENNFSLSTFTLTRVPHGSLNRKSQEDKEADTTTTLYQEKLKLS